MNKALKIACFVEWGLLRLEVLFYFLVTSLGATVVLWETFAWLYSLARWLSSVGAVILIIGIVGCVVQNRRSRQPQPTSLIAVAVLTIIVTSGLYATLAL